MKILFLSPVQPLLTPAFAKASAGEARDLLPKWQMQASWVRALKRQGHQVWVVKYTPDDRIRLGWGERIGQNIRVISQIGLIGQIDLIIYSLGADVLLSLTMWYLKARLSTAKLVVLSGVSPITDGNPRERSMAPMIDLVATNDPGHADQWIKLGAKSAVVLPISAIDKELHLVKIPTLRQALGRTHKDVDVLFIGTLTKEREIFFDKLRQLLPSKIELIVKEFVWEEEYAYLMSGAKIGINLLRPEMRRGANLRLFEIPAFGAMEISSFSRPEWLTPGKEVEVFGSVEEAAALVKRYLGDDQARVKMAKAGKRRVETEHTFDKRAERLMEFIKAQPCFDKAGPFRNKTDGANRVNEVDVSICIVNYKADKELERCVKSIKKFTKGVKWEIIVVDNSADNKWYSGGNNLTLGRAKGKYILFLNPDCWLKNDALMELVKFMDNRPRVGAIEPRQVYESGEIAPTGSLIPKWWIDVVEMTALSRFFGRLGDLGYLGRVGKFKEIDKYRQIEFDRRKNWRTEIISGASMMVTKEALSQVGGFDERLKLYYTDVDLCRRIIKAGFEIWHVGETVIKHKTRGSTSKLPWDRINLIYAGDGREYYRKWGDKIGGEILYSAMKANGIVIDTFRAYFKACILLQATIFGCKLLAAPRSIG